MKPFNLERALAGDKVINGMGIEVVITKLAKPDFAGSILLSQSVATGTVQAYHFLDGKTSLDSRFSGYALFMAPTEVTKWVNLYASTVAGGPRFTIWETEEKADEYRLNGRLGGKAHKITYEE